MSQDTNKRPRKYVSAEERAAAKRKLSPNKAASLRAEEPDARERRKLRLARKQRRRIIALFALCVIIIGGLYAKNTISLIIENKQLEAQQVELEAERDLLKITLENIESDEYIEEQARTLLRLIDPDEIIFVFDDEEISDALDADETQDAED